MSFRLRAAVAVLVVLVFANLGWRIWNRWGLITIHGDDVPLSKVIRSIERQGGITLVSNAAPDAIMTMHVRQVPLSRALQVLSINNGGRWSLGYVVAPDKVVIRGFLDAFANGGKPPAGNNSRFPAAECRAEAAPAIRARPGCRSASRKTCAAAGRARSRRA